MSATKAITTLMMLCLTSLISTALCAPLPAQTVGETQLQALLPDENDLPGFLRIAPAGENLLPEGGYSLATSTHDQFWLPDPANKSFTTSQDTDVHPDHSLAGLRRVLYSANGRYFVEMRVELCDTTESAKLQLLKFLLDSAGIFHSGTFTGSATIGNESLFLPADFYGSSLIFRVGNIFVLISGHQSGKSSRNGEHLIFPVEAVEAIAYQVILKAAQHSELTGISMQQATIAVNGHALPTGPLLVAGQTYVPVQAFAQAMGLTSQWDTKTGAMTLSGAGRKTVALTAGSTAATVGGTKTAALQVPVLKDAGRPVMTLADLLTVTGAKVTNQTAGSVQVKG